MFKLSNGRFRLNNTNVFVFGDSHALFCFNNTSYKIHSESHTMYTVGKNGIPYMNPSLINKNNIFCFVYGEIDCRFRVNQQINLGRNEDDIINQTVNIFFKRISEITLYKKIIIVGVIPPVSKNNFNSNGYQYPLNGSDEERVRYTLKMNTLLEEKCKELNYKYFNPYNFYTRSDGCLKYEYSDNTVHLKDNTFFLEQFSKI